MHFTESTSFTWTTVPANSQVVVPIDTTRLGRGATTSIATNSAFLIPGTDRNVWNGACLRYTILTTGQNVTCLEQVLTGAANAAADWETQGAAGSVTVTAGTTSTREFKPLAPDWRLRIDAGATGPTTLVLKCVITWGEDSGA